MDGFGSAVIDGPVDCRLRASLPQWPDAIIALIAPVAPAVPDALDAPTVLDALIARDVQDVLTVPAAMIALIAFTVGIAMMSQRELIATTTEAAIAGKGEEMIEIIEKDGFFWAGSNRWSTLDAAKMYAPTLVSCDDCTDCMTSVNCVGCTNCFFCLHCRQCHRCQSCFRCDECSRCYDCARCNRCYGLRSRDSREHQASKDWDDMTSWQERDRVASDVFMSKAEREAYLSQFKDDVFKEKS